MEDKDEVLTAREGRERDMGAKETDTLRRVWKAASSRGMTLFRNNVGVAVCKDGSVLRYGLANGSGDLIGITPVTVTPDMVGMTLGLFTSIEVKADSGVVKANQEHWAGTVRKLGGVAAVIWNGDELDEWRRLNERSIRSGRKQREAAAKQSGVGTVGTCGVPD